MVHLIKQNPNDRANMRGNELALEDLVGKKVNSRKEQAITIAETFRIYGLKTAVFDHSFS